MYQFIAERAQKIGASHPQAFLKMLHMLPRGLLARNRERAFRATLRLAASASPFYRRKFEEHGVDIKRARRPEDLGSFYLGPEEVRAAPESFVCAKPELAVESSGTTGHAARVFLSYDELEYIARQAIILKGVYNISEQDRVVSTFDYGFCLDGLLASKGIPYWKSFAMCVGRVDPAEIYRKMSTYRFNIVMSGIPWLARFTEVAEAEGRPYPLKLLVGGGGGGISRRTREWIERFWGAPLCVTYASAEAATDLGFQCLERDGYHLNDFDFFVEILDPDTEGYGEIVLTTVRRKVMPLIRYRTGDVARLITERCRCGLPFRRLSTIRGRRDEIVASVWGNVHPDFFEKILGSVPGIADDWQVALLEKNGKQTFQFRLEVEDGKPDREEIENLILKKIESSHSLGWQAYTQGLAGVEFAYHPKRTLRTGRKLLRLIDERKSA
ncbi:MAG: phenylacetate--CoA ligase family protein [Deltaproteobacteria bacterium]|nr:phenylacetate--CoA ligase family protein [Deltaproteobacteria bacterium]